MRRSDVLTAIIITFFLIEPIAQVVKVAEASTKVSASNHTADGHDQYIEVTVYSPENKTYYYTNGIQLIAYFGGFPGIYYIGYSLDGGPYIEIAPGHGLSHDLNETVDLGQLPQGLHLLQVRGAAFPLPDCNATAKVYFTVTQTLEPSPSPSITATPASTPIVTEFPTALAITFFILVTLASTLAFKRKK